MTQTDSDKLSAAPKTYPKERFLEDSYPIHAGYLYVVCSNDTTERVIRAQFATTVGAVVKQSPDILGIKNCDIAGRDLWHLAM